MSRCLTVFRICRARLLVPTPIVKPLLRHGSTTPARRHPDHPNKLNSLLQASFLFTPGVRRRCGVKSNDLNKRCLFTVATVLSITTPAGDGGRRGVRHTAASCHQRGDYRNGVCCQPQPVLPLKNKLDNPLPSSRSIDYTVSQRCLP